MKLTFRQFQEADYPEYASWFVDADLNHRLGPMDQAWLDAVLTEPAAQGITWAILREAEFVAVIETVFDPDGHLPAGIPAIAVKPSLRGQGIGTAVLHQLLALHHAQGIEQHIAYVAQDNVSARRLVECVGFVQTDAEPNEHGYLEFQHHSVMAKGTIQ
ncbi:MAG: GNAT family N-acetyltransferase [Caldilineaceae bacterium]